MTKKSKQKLKYFENEKSFRGEINSIFISFRGLSVSKNCLRPKSAPLTLVNTDGGNERSQLQNSYWHTVYLYISLTICVKNIYFKNSLNMWVLSISRNSSFPLLLKLVRTEEFTLYSYLSHCSMFSLIYEDQGSEKYAIKCAVRVVSGIYVYS